MRFSTSSSNKALSLLLALLFALTVNCMAFGSIPAAASVEERQGGFTIAVLPIDNLSGVAAPLRELRGVLLQSLSQKGVTLLDEGRLLDFTSRHRLRYSGGIDAELSSAFRSEEQVDAVLILNLELYDGSESPKMAFMARLVGTGPTPRILWMESFSLAGDENPGLFSIGVINDAGTLWNKLTDRTGDALKTFTSSKMSVDAATKIRRYPPQISFGSSKQPDTSPLVAVLPFFNESTRKYAGDIVLLHFVHQLFASGKYIPIEPGVIRDKMLTMRIIMDEGVSLAQADLIANYLQTDLILTGRVYDYLDVLGVSASPSVDFSAQLMERSTKTVIWTSKSYNRGDEDVWFYDWHRVYTANRLAGGMARSVVDRMMSAR